MDYTTTHKTIPITVTTVRTSNPILHTVVVVVLLHTS
jgi:hypothetical protein